MDIDIRRQTPLAGRTELCRGHFKSIPIKQERH